jgi:hypothetical protein
MRKGEILEMKKGWVDLKNGIIAVPRSAQKRKKKDKRPHQLEARTALKTTNQGLKKGRLPIRQPQNRYQISKDS